VVPEPVRPGIHPGPQVTGSAASTDSAIRMRRPHPQRAATPLLLPARPPRRPGPRARPRTPRRSRPAPWWRPTRTRGRRGRRPGPGTGRCGSGPAGWCPGCRGAGKNHAMRPVTRIGTGSCTNPRHRPIPAGPSKQVDVCLMNHTLRYIHGPPDIVVALGNFGDHVRRVLDKLPGDRRLIVTLARGNFGPPSAKGYR
jgi:hypothetical protein